MTRVGHLWLDIGDGEASSGLLADNSSEASLALHNAIWHVAGLAQSWEPDNDLQIRIHRDE